MTDTPYFNQNGELVKKGSGLFAGEITKRFPHLPVTDETQLLTPQQQQVFLKQVMEYHLSRTEP